MGDWSLNIVGGYELPVGNVNMLVGFEGNPSNGSFVGGGSYGYVGGVASVNATTGDWGVAGGLSIPAILPTGTGVIPFVGMGADQNGFYFVASGTLVFTKGTDPTFPDGVATGINVTYATQLASWDDVRDALNQMGIDLVDYFDELFGSPEDPFPASNAITAMAQALAEFFPTPIVLDLDNDNIEYIANTATTGVFFDIDADGFAEKTEWIKPDDGFLVRDLNSNGVIDSQAELFGDNGGTTAYAKLASLNTNNTGASVNALTSADAAWNTLKVWQDSNSNGKTDAGEIKTLATLGITSIGLQSSTDNFLLSIQMA